MKNIIFILLLFVAESSFAQKISISKKLKLADTVMLISHDFTSNTKSVMIVDSAGNKVKQPDLVYQGKLNQQVVQEKKVLSKEEILALAKIFSYKYKPTNTLISSGCFDPHHAIIIIEKAKASYIDLCFHCWDYVTSFQIRDVEIKGDQMEKLYKLFRAHGFTYQMNLEEWN